jgi:hypothetical protein
MRESGYYWMRFVGDNGPEQWFVGSGPEQWFVGHYDSDWDIVTVTGRLENFEGCMFQYGERVLRKV